MLPNPCEGCNRNTPCGGCMCPMFKYYIRVNWAEICDPFRRMAERKGGANKR